MRFPQDIQADRSRETRVDDRVARCRRKGLKGIRYFTEVRRLLGTDAQFERYFEQRTTDLPWFYLDIMKKDLGPLWARFPPSALYHDSNSYLKAEEEQVGVVRAGRSSLALLPFGEVKTGRAV